MLCLNKYVEKIIRIVKCIKQKRTRLARDKNRVAPYHNCKNCGEELSGMYCYNCGQYALDIKQPFFRYIIEYFSNAYQYDGRLPRTSKLLFLKPGKLTLEFEAGRVNSYVHPLKFYMFMSIVFFSVILAFVPAINQDDYVLHYDEVEWDAALDDTLRVKEQNLLIKLNSGTANNNDFEEIVSLRRGKEKGVYVSAGSNILNNVWSEIQDVAKNILPIVIICMLPIYAFILFLFYRNQKKSYLLCFVYSIHIQSVMIALIAIGSVVILVFPDSIFNYIWVSFSTLYFFIYLVWASHVFFHGKWWKSVIKGGLSFIIYLIICLSVVMSVVSWKLSSIEVPMPEKTSSISQ